MGQQAMNEELWAALERAVRTYTESLPVDAYLPDPVDQVAKLMKERAEKRRTAPSPKEKEFLVQDEPLLEIVEETEILEPSPAVDAAASLEDELRNKLSGNDFAELDDM